MKVVRDERLAIGQAVSKIAHILQGLAPDLDHWEAEAAAVFIVADCTGTWEPGIEEALLKYQDHMSVKPQKGDSRELQGQNEYRRCA